MSDINWDEAPTSTEYTYRGFYYKAVNDVLYVYKVHGASGGGFVVPFYWGESTYGLDAIKSMTPRPETKPIYTQAMFDAGELPLVGMNCMVLNSCRAHPKYELCTLNYKSPTFCVYSYDGDDERCDSVANLKFKPIDTRTDSEKAIDEACEIINKDKDCTTWNMNIDCSAAQKAVIIAMINAGYKLEGEM